MEKLYVEHIGDDYRIEGTRVSLESVIIPFLDGFSPEVIASECFPSLTLEQVYGQSHSIWRTAQRLTQP